MDIKIKQRILGIIVVLSLVVILIPMFLDKEKAATEKITINSQIPPAPTANNLNTTTAKINIQSQEEQQLHPKKQNAVKSAQTDSASLPNEAAVAQSQQAPVVAASPAVDLQQAKSENKANTIPAGQAWVVQLGSFSEKNNANNLVKQLQNKGYPAYSQQIATTQGKSLTRVLVGPEIKKADASDLAKRLKQDFKLNGVVMAYQPLPQQKIS